MATLIGITNEREIELVRFGGPSVRSVGMLNGKIKLVCLHAALSQACTQASVICCCLKKICWRCKLSDAGHWEIFTIIIPSVVLIQCYSMLIVRTSRSQFWRNGFHRKHFSLLHRSQRHQSSLLMHSCQISKCQPNLSGQSFYCAMAYDQNKWIILHV